jgi:hypothetical protein
MRKSILIFVFVTSFYLSQAQYSLQSIPVDDENEYDNPVSVMDYLQLQSKVESEFPLVVNDFLNCDMPFLEQIQIHNVLGDLMYRSYHTSEAINLKYIPEDLYTLTLIYTSGEKRFMFISREN